MSDAISIDDLFDRRLDFPDIGASRRLARLGGIDQAKTRLAKVLGVQYVIDGARAVLTG